MILVINQILPTRTEIDRVAWTIADGGINAVSPAVLRELGFQARGAGVEPVLTEILLDRSAPPVARFRVQSIGPGGNSRWSAEHAAITAAATERPTQKRLLVFGSSVAAGVGDASGSGWAGRLKDSLGPDWLVVNKSVSGDTTSALLNRFDLDVVADKWDVVWIGLSLANEGIIGPTPEAVFESYVRNQRRLIKQIRQIGAIPVVSGPYPNSGYGPTEHAYCRRFNGLLNQWGVAGIDFMGSLDDGGGRWIPGYFLDALHPNAAGHEAMFRSIPPGLLDGLLTAPTAGAPAPASITLGADQTNGNPVCYLPKTPLSDFTISFWFKGMDIANKALCGIGPGPARLRAPGGSLRYTSGDEAEIVVDSMNPQNGDWHHAAVVHQSGLERTQLYLDGKLVGAVREKFRSIERFSLGGRADNNPWANAVGVSFWGLTVHRVPCHRTRFPN